MPQQTQGSPLKNSLINYYYFYYSQSLIHRAVWSLFSSAPTCVLYMGIYEGPIGLHDSLSVMSHFLIFLSVSFNLFFLTHTPILLFIQPTAETEKNGTPQGEKLKL